MTHIDRRRFLRDAGVSGAVAGAAWVAPTVLGSTSAFAATSPHTCPSSASMAFVAGAANGSGGYPTGNGNGVNANASNNNGWAFTQAGLTGNDALGVFTSYHPPTPPTPPLGVPQFVVERDPVTTNIAGALVTYTHTLGPLSNVTTYTFSSRIYSVNTNQYTQLLDVQILNASGAVVQTLGSYRTDTTGATGYSLLPASVWTTYSWTFHPATAGTYQFRFRFSFNGSTTAGLRNVGDDIAVTAPTVACA